MSRSRRTQKPQATTAADVVRRRVKQLRLERGWTAQRLADELETHNPQTAFDRDVLASFETGRRRNVSIDEVLLLAYVLDVTPMELLCPFEDELPVAVGRVAPEPRPFYMWLKGEMPMEGQAFSQNAVTSRLRLVRPGLTEGTNRQLVEAADAAVMQANRLLMKVRKAMHEAGEV